MGVALLALVLLGTCDAVGTKVTAKAEFSANPVRRVVTMLQMMQNKIEDEGKTAAELFDKFMCYCETSEKELNGAIDAAEAKIPQLESSIKETSEAAKQTDADLVTHKANRADAETAIAKATELRNKENTAFLKESAESKSNIDALGKAIPAIEKGMGASFLQTGYAAVLRRLSIKADLGDVDRNVLSNFLQQGEGSDSDAPGSGEILGILKQMKDDMSKDLAELTTTEEGAAADFQSMVGAKKKEIAVNTKAIEEKMTRVGELAVELTELKHDLEDSKEQLAEDQKFVADLLKSCEAKKKVEEARVKSLAEEKIALADTIKMLNDDDALELFKKTTLVQASSFLQVDYSTRELKQQALEAIQEGQRKGHRGLHLDFIALALRGKQAGFEKVVTMIDDMVTLLGKEEVDDENKKAYCETEFDNTEDKKKALEGTVSDAEKVIAEQSDAIGSLTEDTAALKKGITDLDVSVARATEQRKTEHAEFSKELAVNNAAKGLIEMAKNRMQKFYNPKLYKAPPKRELSEEERITLNMGGTLAPTNPPGGIAGTGISASFVQLRAHMHARFADDDSADDDSDSDGEQSDEQTYTQKKAESSGVIAMMDNLKADLEKEITAMEMEEKDAQGDYEGTMKDAAEKRTIDSEAITQKEKAKADMEAELQKVKDAKKADDGELMATNGYLAELHSDCDWLLENFATRKEARTNEVDALKKAKAVLAGADYSLVQTRVVRRLRHGM